VQVKGLNTHGLTALSRHVLLHPPGEAEGYPGTAAGLGAATAVLFALNQRYVDIWPAPTPYPITVPWLNAGIALLVVPLIAMLGAGLLTRSRLPIERRL
jgi:hypothetical protein